MDLVQVTLNQRAKFDTEVTGLPAVEAAHLKRAPARSAPASRPP
jgi:hypothetical protein